VELTTHCLGCLVLGAGARIPALCDQVFALGTARRTPQGAQHQAPAPRQEARVSQRLCKSFGISILLCYSATILVATVSLHRPVVVTSERKRLSLLRAPMRERERVDVRGLAMSALVNR